MKKGSRILRFFLYASLVSLVWLGGYVLLSDLFAVSEPQQSAPVPEATQTVSLPNPVSAQWSVLAVEDETSEITAFMLRYADFLADGMAFIEVPVNTKVELTSGGYEVLNVYNPEIPEMFMVSDLCKIFSEETRCMAAEEIGVSLLGVRPKECYILDKNIYEEITELVDGKRRFKSGLSVKEVISSVTEYGRTDDTIKEEMVYWESYRDIDTIVYRVLPGEASAQEYRPDLNETAHLVENLRTGIFEE
ncbi:MAG: hypothetical protein J6J38_00755 [Lachnospiraceae bacterium]|nr:hypothetical protein [Lachnospiraceae bacterium]